MVAGPSFAGSGITYHGRLLRPNGQPVLSSAVQFKIQVRTPADSDCLMFEEVQVRDLSASAGVFTLTVGVVTATELNKELSLTEVFRNNRRLSFAPGKCAVSGDEVSFGSMTPRRLSIAFNDGTFSGWEPLPVQEINFVPFAMESVTISGHKPSNFFRVIEGGEAQSLAPWSAANYEKLVGLVTSTTVSGGVTSIGGTSSGFTGSLSGDVTGGQNSTRVEKIQGHEVAGDQPANGQV
ncbi:MAG TPA: hypothetical protein PL182_09145, partial [Pseudobdellovibrionaceae bacterium]|nr:hypothetical protein [Pseudobdellovibrionaceae bacterium]